MKQYKVYSSIDAAKEDPFLEQLFREGVRHTLNRAIDGTQWVLVWEPEVNKPNTVKLNTAKPNSAKPNTVKLS